MRIVWLLTLIVLPLFSVPVCAANEADDWKLFGGMLSLVQQFVHLAAQSSDPMVLGKGVDAMFSGEHAQANQLASGMMKEILQDVPTEHRSAFVAIGRDLLAIARRERVRTGAEQALRLAPQPGVEFAERPREKALRARRDLHSMGLRYWDEQQFAAAAKRGDRIAVELYVAAQGLPASDPSRTAPR